jgi:hypothetical protein
MVASTVASGFLVGLNVIAIGFMVVLGTFTTFVSMYLIITEVKTKLRHHAQKQYDFITFPTAHDA